MSAGFCIGAIFFILQALVQNSPVTYGCSVMFVADRFSSEIKRPIMIRRNIVERSVQS